MIKEINVCDHCGKESPWGNSLTLSAGYGSIFEQELELNFRYSQ